MVFRIEDRGRVLAQKRKVARQRTDPYSPQKRKCSSVTGIWLIVNGELRGGVLSNRLN
jgi:hypothetical protein